MMNKPTLNILGRKRNIVAVVVENENGEQQHIYDQGTFGFMDDVANLAEAIENPSNTQRFVERLETTIKESKEYVMELKMQIVENVIENINLPFPDENLKSIVEEIKLQAVFIEGLERSLEIANGGFRGPVDSEVPSTE